MKFADATNLDRKSGIAQWRDLLCAPAPAQRSPFRQFSHKIVIPTEANPDFLSRSAGHGRVCGFP
jgi:hypothetical protein